MNQNKIINIVAETTGEEAKNITPESNFFEDLNCEKLEVNDMMLKICQEYGIDIEGKDFDALQTVGDIIQFCEDNSDEI